MIDLSSHLPTATLPERRVPICLRGDLISDLDVAEAALSEAEDALATAPDAPGRTITSTSGKAKAQAAVDAAREQVAQARQAATDAALPFLLRGLSRPAWTGLVNNHPPRDGVNDDRLVGFNAESFPPALVRACLVDPAVGVGTSGVSPDDISAMSVEDRKRLQQSDLQWEQLDEAMTFAQFDELVAVAMELSRRKVNLTPFSSAGSGPTPRSGKKSGPPAP